VTVAAGDDHHLKRWNRLERGDHARARAETQRATRAGASAREAVEAESSRRRGRQGDVAPRAKSRRADARAVDARGAGRHGAAPGELHDEVRRPLHEGCPGGDVVGERETARRPAASAAESGEVPALGGRGIETHRRPRWKVRCARSRAIDPGRIAADRSGTVQRDLQTPWLSCHECRRHRDVDSGSEIARAFRCRHRTNRRRSPRPR